jgi:hypothetical protein
LTNTDAQPGTTSQPLQRNAIKELIHRLRVINPSKTFCRSGKVQEQVLTHQEARTRLSPKRKYQFITVCGENVRELPEQSDEVEQ